MPLHVSSTCAHHQEVKIALHSLWYPHTETSEWSKINKIQIYKFELIVEKFMFEFFGCDYCVLLTVNMLCHVQVTFIQLLNLLERYYVYLPLYLCIKLVNYWDKYTAMHGQQNVKIRGEIIPWRLLDHNAGCLILVDVTVVDNLV